ncbi:hypothetical protein [Thauera humireducens]|uniref:hypothetical protein n=1 Tax=Thauera humireducens TaxID=1134435 RepID=UPI00311FC4CC
MNVLLTFDIEVWCNSWATLEQDFPTSFERYVFGRSEAGDFALPKTLDILDRHGLKGVFFVEPLFAARFGLESLATIVGLIQQAGQEVQLHLHPEWTDEARMPLLPNVTGKTAAPFVLQPRRADRTRGSWAKNAERGRSDAALSLPFRQLRLQ